MKLLLGLILVFSAITHSQAQSDLVPTNLTSITEGAVSNRFQNHMWVTGDGRFHLLFNNGETRDALEIYSSFDGVDWQLTKIMRRSRSTSTGDGVLVGDYLYIVYPLKQNEINLTILEYQRDRGRWKTRLESTVLTSETTAFDRPSIAVDSRGRIWISATATRNGNSAIQIFAMEDSQSELQWIAQPGSINTSAQRSARLIATDGILALVFTDNPGTSSEEFELNFIYRPDHLNARSGWTHPQRLIAYSSSENDRYGTHFNCATDLNGNIHVLTRRGDELMYIKIANLSIAFNTPRPIFTGELAPYSQISVDQNNRIYALCPIKEGNLQNIEILSSENGGATFEPFESLIAHKTSQQSPLRIQAPGRIQERLPILVFTKLGEGLRQLIGTLLETD